VLLKQTDFGLKLKDAPIQQKLRRVIMLTCFIVLVFAIASYLILEYSSFRNAAQKEVITLGEIIASNSSGALAFDSPRDAQEILNGLKANPHIVAACLYNKDGKIFAAYAPDSSVVYPTSSQWEGYRFDKGNIEGFNNVIQGNSKLGILYLKSDLKAMYEQMRYYVLIGILLIAASLLVAFLLSKLLQKSISEPILALEQTAKAISVNRNYSLRATQYGNDEVGSLTHSFNEMLTRIEEQNREIIFFNQNLELKIKERTHLLQEQKDSIENLNAELLKSNHDLEQFAYVASHDLQEPLRKIQTFTQLMQDSSISEERKKSYLEKIMQSSTRMQNLIRDVLSFSRITSVEQAFAITDLNKILENLNSDFELMIREKEAVINHPVMPSINGIPMQLSQLFSNLITNSLKYNDKKPVINISVRKPAPEEIQMHPKLNENIPYIEIKFTDNGIGFEKEFKEKIFQLFQRLHNKQTYSGTGIGLAICKKIVENHNGVIYADSEPKMGATFTVILPEN
jgi:signal transduction histidine kinase